MCGIAGYLGESKNTQATYQLITRLFEKTEARGVDAAGFWGTQAGKDGKIIFHKEPIKSSLLIKKEIWRRTSRLNLNLLLVHARQASQGVGEPNSNKNNHPFVSNNRYIGLVHNGRITDAEYQSLKTKYETFSECDSEILLRVFEAAERYGKQAKADFPDLSSHIAARFCGLRDIFSLVNYGHMAVAIGERHENARYLWLFRNMHRSLWIVDMREELGQVFFCSTPEIWQDAVRACDNLHNIIGRSHKLIEVPPEEIWFFKITNDNPNVQKVQRYDVARDNDLRIWHYDGERVNINRKSPEVEVISKLDNNELVVKGERPETIAQIYDMREFKIKMERLVDKIRSIETQTEILTQEQSITVGDFNQLLESLDIHDRDLEGTLKMLEG